MPGLQKNVRLSERGWQLLRALRYVLEMSDHAVIEVALDEVAQSLLTGCAQRLRLAGRGLIPAEEVERLRAQAAVLVAALNTEAEGRWPRYRMEGDRIEKELDGVRQFLA